MSVNRAHPIIIPLSLSLRHIEPITT